MTAAICFGNRIIPPSEIEAGAEQCAGGLAQLGVGTDDVVAIMLRNSPAFVQLMLAARRIGAYHCPINWHFKAAEAAHILRDSGAKVLFIHADLLPQIEAGLPASLPVVLVRPDDTLIQAFNLDSAAWSADAVSWEAWLGAQPRHSGSPQIPRGNMAYTSGTTGLPKGVRRLPPPPEKAPAAAAALAALNLEINGIGPGMRTLVSAPLYHSAPNAYSLFSTIAGELVVLEPRFDAERTLALIEAHQLAQAYLVPTMFVRMLRLPSAIRSRHKLTSMRFVASTGSPCAPDVKRAMIEWWGPVIHESYASSEAGYITHISSEEWLRKPGSAGRPASGAIVRIMDENGNSLPSGEVGLIYVRQPAYSDFSYNHQADARKALERDGLWSVGDMGYLDADGYLFISDRKSDMVISGGVNIYPAEIEATLINMEGVADCAVFGIPDEEFGEALAAAVQVHDGVALDQSAVRQFIASRMASYKVPKIVTFHAALPREESGKIFKRRLRAPYWENTQRKI